MTDLQLFINPAGELDTQYIAVQHVTSNPICFHAKVPQGCSIQQKAWATVLLLDWAFARGVRNAQVSTFFISSCCNIYCSMYSLWIQAVEQDLWMAYQLLRRSALVSFLPILTRILSFLHELLINEILCLLLTENAQDWWLVSTKRQKQGNSQAYIGNTVHLSLTILQNVNRLIFSWIPNNSRACTDTNNASSWLCNWVGWVGNYSYGNLGCTGN